MSTGLATDDEKAEAEKADIEQAIAKSDKLIGEILASRYQIEVRLGEGAMGSVYKARHVKVGRPFAVKVLHKKLLEDRKVAQRFEREAELAGRLRHPNVVGVVDVGETNDGMRYMVMDFAQGTDLATLLSEAPMPAARVTHLTRQMLEGLYHAHEAGLIHRDFKPENVIVERDDHGTELPRIVDFGIAILREGGESANAQGRLTTNGLVLGTPHYMAPEQAVADPIDHRIDLFALGIVVYEMLCGKLPFDGTGAEVARANLLLDPPAISQRVPYLEVDPLLEAFARQLMAKKRDLRPPTAKAAREILDLIDKDRQAAATALGVPLTVVRPPTRTEPGGVAQIQDEVDNLEIPVAAAAPATGPNGTTLGHATGAARRDATPIPTPPADVNASTSGPMAAAAPRVSRERDIPTDSTAPLTYPKKSKKGLIAALVLFAGVGGAYAIINGGKQDPAANVVAQTETTNPVGSNPTPDLGSAVPTPGSADPTPTTNPGSAAETGSADPATPTTNGSNDVATTDDNGKKPGKKPRDTKRPKDRGKKDPKDGGKTVAEVGKGSATTQVTPPVTNPPTPTGAPSAGEVYTLYSRVGNELKNLQKDKGDSAVADLWPKYRLIQIQQATATEASRKTTATTLAQLSKTAASRR